MENTTYHYLTQSSAAQNNGTDLPAYVGYISMFISAAFYGLNYTPVKKFETGDGMFFQLIVSLAIWHTGLVVQLSRDYPKFYALPILGGFLWTTGNVAVVPVIKLIGIGLGSLFWNASGLVLGWAYARFGWFGIDAQVPSKPTLNYIGVAIGIVSTVVLAFLKPTIEPISKQKQAVNDELALTTMNESEPKKGMMDMKLDIMSKRTKQIIGSFLSLFTGIMYALAYAPALNIQTNVTGASQNNLDYAFSMSTGIFLGSSFYFIVYCIYKKNKPDVYPKVILPALVAGWLWGIANNCYFIATNSLSQAITYPIATVGPSVFASIASLFFGEIKGLKNYFVLGVSMALAIVSSVLCTISQ